ncbi:MAG: hypothetical protein J4F29_15880 [Candidatus Latescibacteria bacterium]|nr:hypothetical protein [Candidatus Latescibacterota bacterium]
MTRRKRLIFYNQHLVGVGHHFRNRQIISALADEYEVYFIDGGRSVPGATLPASVQTHHLIPVFKDLTSGCLTSETEYDIQTVFKSRKQALISLIDRICPDIFIIEYFPFARWELASELLAAICKARSINLNIRIICSLRDVPRRTQNADRVFSILNHHFNALLIHADPQLTRLEDHFPYTNKIHIPVHYTGYVVEPLKDVDSRFQKQNSVLVSAGGGADGYDLINPCIKAWQHLYQRGIVKDRKMVIFTGPFMPQAQYATLESMCNGGPFQIDQFTPHFLQWMQMADLSISRAGYNTCMNILETCTRAILVPGSLVSDQEFRAHQLSKLGLADTISPKNLTTNKLAKAIVNALSSAPPVHNIALNGAATTRDLIRAI